MTEETYGWVIDFEKLYGCEVITHPVDGVEQECLVVPIRQNGIHLSSGKYKGGIRMYGACLPTQGKVEGATHFVTLSRPKDMAKEMRERGFHPYPIIGKMMLKFRRERRSQTGDFSIIDKLLK